MNTRPLGIETRFTWANILQIVLILVGLVAGWYTLEGRVSANSDAMVRAEQSIAKLEAKNEQYQLDRLELTRTLAEMASDIRYMRAQLDGISKRNP